MMDEAAVQALADDIEANGLQHPIIVFDGTVIDGRNRPAACELAGVAPHFVEMEFEDEAAIWDCIVSENVRRREMALQQRALVAAELATLARGGDRRSADYKGSVDPSIEEAADLLTVSSGSVKRAELIVGTGDETAVDEALISKRPRVCRWCAGDGLAAVDDPPKKCRNYT